MEAEPKTFEISPPMTSFDTAICQKLRDYLQQNGVFETETESNHRVQVINKLNKLLKYWIKFVSGLKTKNQTTNFGGKIYTFGSYRLGVHSKGADIDALCVAPKYVNRSDFFDSFYKTLALQPEVTDLRAIETAFVPVIKLNFDGIELDLLFARINLEFIPENLDLNNIEILKNLDQKCARSLNGCRVADDILHSVPHQENFRSALRAIKLWAKRRGVYSNILGYFGGVTWALLVARTCQLHPDATAATIVHEFFLVFSKWKWPIPVSLKAPEENHFNFQVWDSIENPSDRLHLMPIITPSYPQQNSTFNVSHGTKQIIILELIKGLAICDEIMHGKAGWCKLFEPSEFFKKFQHFVVVAASGETKEDHLSFCGLVESRLRHFVNALEKIEHVKVAQVNPRAFVGSELDCFWVVGLVFEKVENWSIDFTSDVRHFTDGVRRQAGGNKCLMRIKYVRKRQLGVCFPGVFRNVSTKLRGVTKSCKRPREHEILGPRKRTTYSHTGVTTYYL